MASHWLFYNRLPSVKELASSLPVNSRIFLCSVTGTDSKSMVTVNNGWEDMCSVCSTHTCLQLKAPCVKKNWTESLQDMAPKNCDGQIPNPLREISFPDPTLYFFWNPLRHGTSWTRSVLCLQSHLFCLHGSSVTPYMNLSPYCVSISQEIKNLYLGGQIIRI